MVSVGTLAAILNVAAIVVLAVVGRILERTVRRFASARLRDRKRAPVVHDSDTSLLQIPFSIIKYRRYPAILITIILSGFLVASEVTVELGVNVTENCQTITRVGKVINKENTKSSAISIVHSASAYHMQHIAFLDGDMKSVQAGTPIMLYPKTCLKCLEEPEYPTLQSNCSWNPAETYPAGDVSVGFADMGRAYGIILAAFKVGDRVIIVEGDMIFNSQKYEAFLIYNTTQTFPPELYMLQYGHQQHCHEFEQKVQQARMAVPSSPNRTNIFWEKTRAPVRTAVIRCRQSTLDHASFITALQIYRSIQLENNSENITYHTRGANGDEGFYEAMSEDNINRDVLSLKIIDDNASTGQYFEYVQCTSYEWIYMIPFFVTLLLILLLGSLAFVLSSSDATSLIPFNSSSWYREALKAQDAEALRVHELSEKESWWRRKFTTSHDEMVMVEEEGRKWMVVSNRASGAVETIEEDPSARRVVIRLSRECSIALRRDSSELLR